jgi:hypothetical protein
VSTLILFVTLNLLYRAFIVNGGTNQLLIFELRVNGVKYPAVFVKVLFNNNTQYQIVNVKKLMMLNANDILTVWV